MISDFSDKDKLTALLEEYRQLKSEITEWSRVRNQFIVITLTVSATIFSFGFSTQNPYIFLVPLLIQIPCMYICLAERSSILTISGYIQHEIEPQISTLNWETHITNTYIKKKRSPIKKLTQGISGFVLYPIIASFFLSAFYWPWLVESNGLTELNIIGIIIFLLLLLVALIIIIQFIWSYGREIDSRKKIKEEWDSKKNQERK